MLLKLNSNPSKIIGSGPPTPLSVGTIICILSKEIQLSNETGFNEGILSSGVGVYGFQ